MQILKQGRRVLIPDLSEIKKGSLINIGAPRAGAISHSYFLAGALFIGFGCVASSYSQEAPPVAVPVSTGENLTQQAADPTAPLMAFNFKQEYVSSFYQVPGSGSDFTFQPVIPFRAWRTSNLLRATVNYNTSGPTGSGVNNVSVFDLIVFNEEWGRWGFGPLIQFVPNNGNGNDTALAGPAVGFVARHGKMNLGLFNQNLFGAETRFSSLQPIVAYVLPHGWSLAQATRSGASTGRVRASSTSRSACRSPR